MSKFDENLFGRIAVLNSYISRKDLEHCLELQQSGSTRKHIGHILLEEGHLTQEQFNRIVEIRNKKIRKLLRNQDDASENDREFARLVLQEGMLELDELEEAVLEQQRLRQFNLQFSLAETLVSRKQLTVESAKEILSMQGRSMLRCSLCDVQYRVVDCRADELYHCPRCKSELIRPVFLDPLMVEGVIGSEEVESTNETASPEMSH